MAFSVAFMAMLCISNLAPLNSSSFDPHQHLHQGGSFLHLFFFNAHFRSILQTLFFATAFLGALSLLCKVSSSLSFSFWVLTLVYLFMPFVSLLPLWLTLKAFLSLLFNPTAPGAIFSKGLN
jgi:hypothetical protein